MKTVQNIISLTLYRFSSFHFRLLGRRTIDSTKFSVDPRQGHAAIALSLSRKHHSLGKRFFINFVSSISVKRVQSAGDK